ncbi:FecR domain-containing protein [Leeia sp. IMCC25680]|uniref:FecR domain-containing protein n=1 Tax=Leeia aquatica TaxID=2725557 RepID=A0A847SFV5_9NEIS|nr:FecR domain-containing protein [Leeia aquatica]
MLLLAGLLPLQLWAAAGKVEFVSGEVLATGSNGQPRTLSRGSELDVADLINTQNGRVQIRFTDGGYVSLAPRTQFKITQYKFNGKNDGEEQGFFSLFRGSMRTVTGLIGKGRREAYQVTTPTATIGIRGTEYTAEQTDGLKVAVAKGSVVVTNEISNVVLQPGESVFFEGPRQPPKPVEKSAVVVSQQDEEQTLPKDVLPLDNPLITGNETNSNGGSAVVLPLSDGSGYNLAYVRINGGSPGIGLISSSTVTFTNGGTSLSTYTNSGYNNNPGTTQVQETMTSGLLGWGRWVNGTSGGNDTGLSGQVYSGSSQGFHYMVGQPTASIPTTGSYTYKLIGGTTPTATTGQTSNSFNGSLDVDFVAQTAKLTGSITSGANVYSFVAPNSGSVTATFNLTSSTGGGSCPGCTFNGEGFFAGSSAQQAGINYKLDIVGNWLIGVAAFQQQ